MDFTERIYIYHYISLGDIFASLGGLKSSFGTIFEYITPIFIISFMYQLSTVVQDYASRNFRDELIDALKFSRNQLADRDFEGKASLLKKIDDTLDKLRKVPDESDWEFEKDPE